MEAAIAAQRPASSAGKRSLTASRTRVLPHRLPEPKVMKDSSSVAAEKKDAVQVAAEKEQAATVPAEDESTKLRDLEARREAESAARDLDMAAAKGDCSSIAEVINTGIDLETAGSDGRTALWVAASCGHADAVQMLVDAGANLNAVCASTSFTALHAAVQAGHTRVVSVLAKGGADSSLESTNGKTALDIAKRKHLQDMIAVLQPHSSGSATDT